MTKHIALAKQFNTVFEKCLLEIGSKESLQALRKMRMAISDTLFVAYEVWVATTAPYFKVIMRGDIAEITDIILSPAFADWGLEGWETMSNEKRKKIVHDMQMLVKISVEIYKHRKPANGVDIAMDILSVLGDTAMGKSVTDFAKCLAPK